MDLRQRLLEARTEDEFKRILLKHTQELAEEQAVSIRVDRGSPSRLSTEAESNVSLLLYTSPLVFVCCSISVRCIIPF